MIRSQVGFRFWRYCVILVDVLWFWGVSVMILGRRSLLVRFLVPWWVVGCVGSWVGSSRPLSSCVSVGLMRGCLQALLCLSIERENC